MFLYKYASFEIAKKIIMNHEVRFTQPGAFNDIFEMIPSFKNSFKDEFIINFINQTIKEGMFEKEYRELMRNTYLNLEGNIKKYFTLDEYELYLQQFINHILMKEQKNLPEFILERLKRMSNNTLTSNWISILNNHIGILCLSEIYDNELMWANYAENHTGLVLEFETEHHFFKPIIKVEYTHDIPTINLEEFEEIETNPLKYLKIIKNKSINWNYEREQRIFKLLRQNDRIEDNLDSLSFPIFLFRFPPHCLKGIIFGARFSEKTIDKFLKLVDYKIYSNLAFSKMTINHDLKVLERISL